MLVITNQFLDPILVRADIKEGFIKIIENDGHYCVLYSISMNKWEPILIQPTVNDKGNIHLGIWITCSQKLESITLNLENK